MNRDCRRRFDGAKRMGAGFLGTMMLLLRMWAKTCFGGVSWMGFVWLGILRGNQRGLLGEGGSPRRAECCVNLCANMIYRGECLLRSLLGAM